MARISSVRIDASSHVRAAANETMQVSRYGRSRTVGPRGSVAASERGSTSANANVRVANVKRSAIGAAFARNKARGRYPTLYIRSIIA